MKIFYIVLAVINSIISTLLTGITFIGWSFSGLSDSPLSTSKTLAILAFFIFCIVSFILNFTSVPKLLRSMETGEEANRSKNIVVVTSLIIVAIFVVFISIQGLPSNFN